MKSNLQSISSESDIEFVKEPLSDDFMNLIEVACSFPNQEMLFGVSLMNDHCYVPDLSSSSNEVLEPLVKRSVELKIQILTELLGWNLIVLDENDFKELGDKA